MPPPGETNIPGSQSNDDLMTIGLASRCVRIGAAFRERNTSSHAVSRRLADSIAYPCDSDCGFASGASPRRVCGRSRPRSALLVTQNPDFPFADERPATSETKLELALNAHFPGGPWSPSLKRLWQKLQAWLTSSSCLVKPAVSLAAARAASRAVAPA